jgi:DNA ligase-1
MSIVLTDLAPGETAEIKGSGKNPYVLRNIDGVYDCSCVAWKMQSHPIDERTCKHLCQLRGPDAELTRVGYDNLPTKVKKSIDKLAKAASGGSAPAKKTKGKAAKPKKAKPAKVAPPVLLAHNFDTEDPTGKWLSEKFDGVRAWWTGLVFLSRAGNVFHAPEWFTKDLPPTPLDGELWMGRGLFQKTVSIVRRKNAGDLWKKISYRVFDAPMHPGVVEHRWLAMAKQIANAPYAQSVPQRLCKGEDDLKVTLAAIEAQGGEGLMLRLAGSSYEEGRSYTLLKVKTFHDAEAIVTGYVKGKGKHKGRMGALIVQMDDGQKFKIGTGFSNKQREEPQHNWIDTSITYRFKELTDIGIPKFASFLRIRED